MGAFREPKEMVGLMYWSDRQGEQAGGLLWLAQEGLPAWQPGSREKNPELLAALPLPQLPPVGQTDREQR